MNELLVACTSRKYVLHTYYLGIRYVCNYVCWPGRDRLEGKKVRFLKSEKIGKKAKKMLRPMLQSGHYFLILF